MNNKNTILVSVIIPVYQVEAYIERCIQSIIHQSYKYLEILLIDDGTKDRSGQICEAYKEKDSRIKVFHKVNGGLSDARNYGIERASGQYIVFVDSDDFVHEDYIKSLLKLCDRQNADIAVCDFEKTNGNQITDFGEKRIKECTGIEAVQQSFGINHVYMTVAWNKMYKRALFDDIRFPKGKIHEDEATTYKLFLKAQKVVLSKEKLYAYFLSDDSIMRANYSNKRLDIVDAVVNKICYLHQNSYKELERLSRIELSNILIYHYYNCEKYLLDSKKILEKLKMIFFD